MAKRWLTELQVTIINIVTQWVRMATLSLIQRLLSELWDCHIHSHSKSRAQSETESNCAEEWQTKFNVISNAFKPVFRKEIPAEERPNVGPNTVPSLKLNPIPPCWCPRAQQYQHRDQEYVYTNTYLFLLRRSIYSPRSCNVTLDHSQDSYIIENM